MSTTYYIQHFLQRVSNPPAPVTDFDDDFDEVVADGTLNVYRMLDEAPVQQAPLGDGLYDLMHLFGTAIRYPFKDLVAIDLDVPDKYVKIDWERMAVENGMSKHPLRAQRITRERLRESKEVLDQEMVTYPATKDIQDPTIKACYLYIKERRDVTAKQFTYELFRAVRTLLDENSDVMHELGKRYQDYFVFFTEVDWSFADADPDLEPQLSTYHIMKVREVMEQHAIRTLSDAIELWHRVNVEYDHNKQALHVSDTATVDTQRAQRDILDQLSHEKTWVRHTVEYIEQFGAREKRVAE